MVKSRRPRRPGKNVMSQSLLATRRFAPLFWRQFFAAFNDNFLKNALVLLILAKIGGAEGASLVTLAGAIFIAPFFLLSDVAGALFVPVKYGILPNHLPQDELPAGNALVESATFFAILSGTIAGGL